MVKQRKKNTKKKRSGKGFKANGAQFSIGDDQCAQAARSATGLQGIINNTIRLPA